MFTLDTAELFQSFFKKLDMLDPNFDLKGGSGLYYSHPYVSYEIRPGYQREGRAHINSLGFRGDEIEQKKVGGIYRIVAIGDSTTYGIYNKYNETYPYFLQKQLRAEFGTDKIEVINAGLVSATSAENLVRFFLKILPLSPDMIIWYGSFSDVFPRVFNDYSGDYYHFRRTPHTENHSSYLFKLFERGILVRFFPDKGLRNDDLLAQTWKFENLPSTDSERIRNFENSGPEVFRRNLKYIVDAALANGVKPVFVTFAFDQDKPNWNHYIPDELWEKGIRQDNEVILELAQTYRLPTCSFYEYGLVDKRVFDNSIHLNAYGNKKLADCIRAAIGKIEMRPIVDAVGR